MDPAARPPSKIQQLVYDLTGATERSAGAPKPDLSSTAPHDRFAAWAATLGPGASVLEVGTKQSREGAETHHHLYFPSVPRDRYVMADIADGADVDVVADLHRLPTEWSGRFDGVVASAVFEHLERPWIAAKEVARVLKPGGRCWISTHQTYPLHSYPSDYFRFSREALSLLVTDADMEVVEVGYQHRTRIITEPDVMSEAFARGWNKVYPSYLVVNLFGAKPD